jgi:hypothetical protein
LGESGFGCAGKRLVDDYAKTYILLDGELLQKTIEQFRSERNG